MSNVYTCVDLSIAAPNTFVIDPGEWRPRYLEGEVVVLDRDEKVIHDQYVDGPLNISATLVRICTSEQVKTKPEWRRLVGLITLGATGKQAHRVATSEFGAAVTDTLLERYPDDAVLAFRIKELVKRYTE